MSAAEENHIKKPSHLGILAGGGALPRYLIEACRGQNIVPFVIGFEGQTDAQTLKDQDHLWTHIGAAGKIINTLKSHNIHDLVLLGHIRRPSLKDLRPDLKTAAFFAKEGWKAQGDDGLLKALRRFLEQEGFRLHAAQDFMPDVLCPEGLIAGGRPTQIQKRDIARGVQILSALSSLDIGQAVVIQQGHVLGIEAAEGTNALIRRCGDLQRAGSRAVLVKLCKKEQDKALDLPTIGPQTIDALIQAGMAGLAVHAGQSFVCGREELIKKADIEKVFVTGIHPEEYREGTK